MKKRPAEILAALFLAGFALPAMAQSPQPHPAIQPLPSGALVPMTDQEKADRLKAIIAKGYDYLRLARALRNNIITPRDFAQESEGGDEKKKESFASEASDLDYTVNSILHQGASSLSQDDFEKLERGVDELAKQKGDLDEAGVKIFRPADRPNSDFNLDPTFTRIVIAIGMFPQERKDIDSLYKILTALTKRVDDSSAREKIHAILDSLNRVRAIMDDEGKAVDQALLFGEEESGVQAALEDGDRKIRSEQGIIKKNLDALTHPSPGANPPDGSKVSVLASPRPFQQADWQTASWVNRPTLQIVNLDQAGLGRGYAGQQRGAQMILMPRIA